MVCERTGVLTNAYVKSRYAKEQLCQTSGALEIVYADKDPPFVGRTCFTENALPASREVGANSVGVE